MCHDQIGLPVCSMRGRWASQACSHAVTHTMPVPNAPCDHTLQLCCSAVRDCMLRLRGRHTARLPAWHQTPTSARVRCSTLKRSVHVHCTKWAVAPFGTVCRASRVVVGPAYLSGCGTACVEHALHQVGAQPVLRKQISTSCQGGRTRCGVTRGLPGWAAASGTDPQAAVDLNQITSRRLCS